MTDATRRAPSIYAVAERAGVSHQTVSRVLNDFPGIRPETRERVLAAIVELGYRPNRAARALVTSRTHALGVLVPEVADFGPVSSLQAIERAARDAGFHVLVTSTAVDRAAVRESLEFLLGHAVEAVVAVAPSQSLVDTLGVVPRETPVVLLQAVGAPAAVTVDQALGARLATRHLLDLGHRGIQQVAGPADSLEAVARRDAVDAELAAAGVPLRPHLGGDWTADTGYRAVGDLDEQVTAVVCGNDQLALGVLHGLVDAGRSVPGDVSLVGFDDIPESAHSLPPLTTVHQDFDEVGRRAVARVLALLAGSEVPAEDAIVPPRLVERGSTAAPRAGR